MTIQVQHDVHDFRQLRSLIQPALGLEPWLCSGWLVYPIPFLGVGINRYWILWQQQYSSWLQMVTCTGPYAIEMVEDPEILTVLGIRIIASGCFYRSDVRKESIAGLAVICFCSH